MDFTRDRLPEQVLYGEISTSERRAGDQKKRYKDQNLTLLKKFKVAPEMLKIYVTDRNVQRMKQNEGSKKFKQIRNENMRLGRHSLNKT